MGKAHSKALDNAEKSRWERARMLAIVTAQPHCKKKLDPRKFLPLPWDKEKAQPKAERKKTREEVKKRYEKLVENL